MIQNNQLPQIWFRAPREPLLDLIRHAAPSNSKQLDELVRRLDPQFEFIRGEDALVFEAHLGPPNIVRFGMECTRRLQAHTFAGGVLICALSTAGYGTLPVTEKVKLHAPIDTILTWAVGRDLQQWLRKRSGELHELEKVLKGAARCSLVSDLRNSGGSS